MNHQGIKLFFAVILCFVAVGCDSSSKNGAPPRKAPPRNGEILNSKGGVELVYRIDPQETKSSIAYLENTIKFIDRFVRETDFVGGFRIFRLEGSWCNWPSRRPKVSIC